VFVTPDELGDAWAGAKVKLPLHSYLNGEWFGSPDAGTDMQFDFGQLVAHAARTRPLTAGTLVGSGTIANQDTSVGASCLAEKRMLEIIADGKATTPFMKFGDTIRIEMLNDEDENIFGSIEQTVLRHGG
jgi:fumarylacetoacetate (FAA) hydrolase